MTFQKYKKIAKIYYCMPWHAFYRSRKKRWFSHFLSQKSSNFIKCRRIEGKIFFPEKFPQKKKKYFDL